MDCFSVMCDSIVEHPIVDVPRASALALTFKNTRLVIIPRSSRSIYSPPPRKIYHGCAPDSGPLIYFVPMLTQTLSPLKWVQQWENTHATLSL